MYKNVSPALNYFTDPSPKLTKENFKKIVYEHLKLKKHKLDEHEGKIDQIIREGYQDYCNMCKLVSKGIYYVFRIYYYEKDGKFVASTLKYISQNKLGLDKAEDICCLYTEGELKLVRRLDYRQKNREFQTIDEGLELAICTFTSIKNPYRILSSKEYDIPCFILKNDITDLIGENTKLMLNISSSNGKIIDDLINQYSLRYGNNPILLSIAKGYNHADTDHKGPQPSLQQKNIINKLLKREDLDINCIYHT